MFGALYVVSVQSLRFIVKEAVCSQCGYHVHDEVIDRPVSGVYQLCRIFEHVIDGLYDAPLSQHDFVPHGHELVLHVASDARDQVYSVLKEHVEEPWRDVASVGEELAIEGLGQDNPDFWISVVHIGTCEAESDDFSPVVADEMQLEVVAPAHRPLPVSSQPLEHLVGIAAQVVAYGNHRGVHEADARAFAEGGEVEEKHHLEEHAALQLHEAVVGHCIGEISIQSSPV